VIDAIRKTTSSNPRNNGITAKRILERLRSETRLHGWLHDVKDYVRAATLRQQEMFVPLTHAPGEHSDFGEALVIVGGVEQRRITWRSTCRTPTNCFVMAFPAETTEAFWRATFRPSPISAAFRPRFCTTTRDWPSEDSGDGTRQKTRAFSELQSHYLFAEKFGRPRKATTRVRSKGSWVCAA